VQQREDTLKFMTKLKASIFLLVIIFMSCGSDRSKNFSLTVKHYGGGAGITIIYSIDVNGLQVDTNCDLADCKEATVYKRSFSKLESEKIYTVLNSLRLDTLKRKYEPEGLFFDGLYTEIKFAKGFFSTHKSSFDNVSTPTTEKLFTYIDELIPEKKYQFENWGKSE
jgi:hypothetical protein